MATSAQMTESEPSNPDNTFKKKSDYDRKLVNISFVFWLFLSYFMIRFMIGKIALAVLILTSLAIIARILLVNLRLHPIIFWTPVLVISLISTISLAADSDLLVTYATFNFVALFFHAAGYSIFKPVPTRFITPIVIIFILSVIPFIILPSLSDIGTQPIDTAAEVGAQLRKFQNLGDDTFRARAYFYHSAELGQFATSLFIVLSQSVKYAVSVKKVDLSFKYKVFEAVLYLGLFATVQASDSRTANIILILTLINRYISSTPVTIIAPLVLLSQFITQMFFAGEVAAILKSGSFWWRYDMARHILADIPNIQFTPHKLGSQYNWPHSIFLDFSLVFGFVGPFILIINQFILLVLPQYRGATFGWSCLFLIVVATNPVGASAVYVVMAVAFAYAERIAFEVSANRRSMR